MKKGFTLIELLAVIVILAIIALIATPVILNIINDTRESANERSAEIFISSLQNEIASKNLIEEFNPSYCEVVNKILTCDDVELKVTEKDSIDEGEIYLENGKIINYWLKIDGKEYYKNETDSSCFISVIPGEINDYVCDSKNIVIPANLKLEVSEIDTIEFDDDKCNMVYETLAPDDFDCTLLKQQFNSLKDSNVEEIYNSLLGAFAKATYKDHSKNKNKIDTIGDAVFGYRNIESVVIGNGIKNIGYASFIKNNITILKLADSIESIDNYAFLGNSIKNVKIPSSLTQLNESVFEENKIKNIVIPSNITKIDEATFFNNELESVDFTNATNLSIISKRAFGLNNLEEVNIPDSVTRIGVNAFFGNKIRRVTIGSGIIRIGTGSFSSGNYSNKPNNSNNVEEVTINIPKNLNIFEKLNETFIPFNTDNIVWKSE